ncbi:DUF1707 SHOCT-like domain-containing protein [Rhodococcus sp. P1Y]|uniref:DUF1707 SHOCT-like domain-containing protein n=1 Tax=Rhodococcus sp. P1Y TaxID=1302308 RepID=UPI000EB4859B|nr:DUF1707 domain-containing protein [Rhodococcus sp. P1Y]AYJ51031.1 DUF1707 domain-containing protein [Rhodococcus sp. P1Y]
MSSDMEKLRVGTAEREGVAQILGSAMADGRLTLAEYEERVDAVWKSSTRGELARVTDDLPAVTAESESDVDKSSEWREYFDEWRWWFGGAIIMSGIWGFQSISDGELNGYWPGWPLGIWALILVAMIFMPDDDEDDKKSKKKRKKG